MNIDIRTLVIVLSIASLLQVLALFVQFRINKAYRGVGWWVLGYASLTVGYGLLFLRGLVTVKLITVILANGLVILGPIFLYIGVLRFLGHREDQRVVISILAFYLLSFLYYTYVDDDITLRTVIVYGLAAAVSLLTAQKLHALRTRAIAISATVNALLFFAQGCFFAFRATVALTVDVIGSLFGPTVMMTASFVFLFVEGMVMTFGLIIMVNQRLHTEMREAKERFELIFNTSPDAVLITRLEDGAIVSINEGFTALTGFTRAETIGKSSQDIHLWDDIRDRQRILRELGEQGLLENWEVTFRRRDGSPITGILSARMITLQGQPHIISVTRDITDRKRAEEALRKSEEQVRLMLNSTAEAIYGIDMEGNCTFANPACFKILGYADQEQLLGRNMHNLIHHSHADGTPMPVEVCKIYRAFREGRGMHVDDEVLWRADGTSFPAEYWSYPQIENGVLRGAVVTFLDITKRKRALEALEESERRYRELSIIDNLTQLYNSRHFAHQFTVEIDRVNRYGEPLTLIMLDVDDFKAFNDTYGHVEGDQVLARLGQVIRRCLRRTDSAYRYGGEEFTILLPETGGRDGVALAERIRTEFARETFRPSPGGEVHLSMSLGLAQYRPPEDARAFVNRVDQLMYQAKKAGKNRVCAEPDPQFP
jgi:diguanylate cyclase (GGDEF)-like protein/PAS domain S-box-containing protein